MVVRASFITILGLFLNDFGLVQQKKYDVLISI